MPSTEGASCYRNEHHYEQCEQCVCKCDRNEIYLNTEIYQIQRFHEQQRKTNATEFYQHYTQSQSQHVRHLVKTKQEIRHKKVNFARNSCRVVLSNEQHGNSKNYITKYSNKCENVVRRLITTTKTAYACDTSQQAGIAAPTTANPFSVAALSSKELEMQQTTIKQNKPANELCSINEQKIPAQVQTPLNLHYSHGRRHAVARHFCSSSTSVFVRLFALCFIKLLLALTLKTRKATRKRTADTTAITLSMAAVIYECLNVFVVAIAAAAATTTSSQLNDRNATNFHLNLALNLTSLTANNMQYKYNNNNNYNNHYYYNNDNNNNNISNNNNNGSNAVDYTLLVDNGMANGTSEMRLNVSDGVNATDTDDATTEYIFDRTDVRVIFITMYVLVFCCCFFGNLLVILVVTLSRRLRSITNFFLANLALADFCVGLFCVMQNLSIYLIESWVFGEFLCRMYQFVQQLSYTASIFILVVICMERYFAIVHPITCKQILTAARLRMAILTVWITSAVYSTPKFVFSKTIKNVHTLGGREEEICVLDRKMFNSKLLDMINFGLLYVIPLVVMTVLYSKIAIALWRSSRGLSHHAVTHQQHHDNGMNMHNSMHQHHHHNHGHAHAHQQQNNHLQQLHTATTQAPGTANTSTTLSRKQSSKYEKRGVSITESQLDNCQVTLDADRPVVSTCRKASFYHHTHLQRGASVHGAGAGGSLGCTSQRGGTGGTHMSHSTNNVLRARRGVVRMLIIFVLTFALCNLPYHARKMWQYWSRSYRGDSNFNALLTPLTFLVTYFNSGINPLLYAFLSRNFRKGMRELLLCSWKKGKGKSSSNSSMHHKRKALQTHSIPTDITHIGNEQL